MSSNIKWTYRKKHERGEYTLPATMMGYRKAASGEGYDIVEEEAETVQRIFREYVGGMTTTQIAKGLRDDGIKTPMGNSRWTAAGVVAKLCNEKYMGAAILGKTYKPDLLSTRRVNNGEAPRYYVECGHPAIVSKELYELAQMEKKTRITANDEAVGSGKYSSKYPFSGLLVCHFCHTKYRRHLRTVSGKKVPSWGCITHITKGNNVCQNHHINESTLEEAYRKVIKETMKDSSLIMQSLEQMIKDEMTPHSDEQIENIESRILNVQEKVLELRKDKQSNAISQTDYDEQIKQLGLEMKTLEQEKETMTKDTSDYLKATMWMKDFNEHIKEGNILTDGDQYIMKKLIKEIVVEGRKTVNFIFKYGIEKRISL